MSLEEPISIPKKTKRKKKLPQYDTRKLAAYGWTLSRYLGDFRGMARAKFEDPLSDIGHGLKASFVVGELNRIDCFDPRLRYRPGEGDNLIIVRADNQKRIEFIYRKGEWVEDFYCFYVDELETMVSGKVVEAPSDPET